jgi:NADH dehydrogenase
MPMSGRGRALYQPIWAEDAAACVAAALADGAGPEEDGGGARLELAGPDTLSHRQLIELALRSFGRRRPIVPVPTPIVSRTLRAIEAVLDGRAFATWDEAELMEVPMIAAGGTRDAEALGVSPQPMAAVLGAA